MPKTQLKRKKANGKLPANAVDPKHCLPQNAKSAKLPQVPLAVTPESALYGCAWTPSSTETSTPNSLSPSSNLATAFATESSASITKKTSSVVKKEAMYIDFCNSAQVKTELLKYIKSAADLPVDQEAQISFLVRKFNSSALTAAFTMLIGKVAGVTPIAFFPLPPKKEDLIKKFLSLIYDTKSMIINTEENCYLYV